MGYSDISIFGSDTASDLDWFLTKNRNSTEILLCRLQEELETEHSIFNTQGCVNVALTLTQGEGQDLFQSPKLDHLTKYHEIMNTTLIKLATLIVSTNNLMWEDNNSKKYHLDRYFDLLDKMLDLEREFSEQTNGEIS